MAHLAADSVGGPIVTRAASLVTPSHGGGGLSEEEVKRLIAQALAGLPAGVTQAQVEAWAKAVFNNEISAFEASHVTKQTQVEALAKTVVDAELLTPVLPWELASYLAAGVSFSFPGNLIWRREGNVVRMRGTMTASAAIPPFPAGNVFSFDGYNCKPAVTRHFYAWDVSHERSVKAYVSAPEDHALSAGYGGEWYFDEAVPAGTQFLLDNIIFPIN